MFGGMDVQVAGTSGKVQQGTDEDTEGISSETHAQAITEVLGEQRRNEVSCAFHAWVYCSSP